jgi:hypothetical protein
MATISNEYKQYLLSITPDDIDKNFIESNFVDTCEKTKDGSVKVIPSKVKTTDTFVLEKGEYFNTEKITTGVGMFIFNKFLIEESFKDVVGYINEPVTDSVMGMIDAKLSDALLNDKITVQERVTFLDKLEWISKQFNSVLTSSFTMKTIKPVKKVIDRRDALIKQNKERLDNGDVTAAVEIESEVLKLAKEELKDDPGMDLYNSGARGSFKNNYKSNSIMKGPVFNPTTGKWDFVGKSFIEGIEKKDIPTCANSVVTGAYPKAVGTQVGGYQSKQFLAAFQGVVLDEKGSDCGTSLYLDILLTKDMKRDVLYRYIVEGKKLTLLTDENIDKYIGTRVKLRSPMFCKGDKLCSKCAGVMFEKLGITNIGLTTTKVTSTLMNLNMKKFHDSTVSLLPIDISNISL